MRIYFAPMQGVTGWPYRLTHLKHYDGIDRYYMPFISVHQSRSMKGGEKRDLQPDHNVSGRMVPQLLPGSAEDSLAYMEQILDAGYDEVSLNFGCPARTVTTKGKGAGILETPDKLDEYLEHLFTGMIGRLAGLKVSVKTRIGMNDCSAASELIRIYNRYPIAEVQVHARLGKDAYDGVTDKETFRMFYEEIRHPVCYNGDIRSLEDFQNLKEEFPDLAAVMIGRGLVADPMLAEKIQQEMQQRDAEQGDVKPDDAPLGCVQHENTKADRQQEEKKRLIRFHDDVCNAWYECYGQEHPAICRMLEIWDYLGASFPGCERKVRKIRKARNLQTYRQLAGEVLMQEYHPGKWHGKYPVGH